MNTDTDTRRVLYAPANLNADIREPDELYPPFAQHEQWRDADGMWTDEALETVEQMLPLVSTELQILCNQRGFDVTFDHDDGWDDTVDDSLIAEAWTVAGPHLHATHMFMLGRWHGVDHERRNHRARLDQLRYAFDWSQETQDVLDALRTELAAKVTS